MLLEEFSQIKIQTLFWMFTKSFPESLSRTEYTTCIFDVKLKPTSDMILDVGVKYPIIISTKEKGITFQADEIVSPKTV